MLDKSEYILQNLTTKYLLKLINIYEWVQVKSLKASIFLLKTIFGYKKKESYSKTHSLIFAVP